MVPTCWEQPPRTRVQIPLASFEKEGLKGKGLKLDVNNPQQVEDLMSHLTDLEQCPSILVNNAGITAIIYYCVWMMKSGIKS